MPDPAFGFNARQMQNVIPSLVSERGDGELGIRMKWLHGYTVGAINQLADRQDDQEQRIKDLEARVDELEEQLT
jgi:hypothetical protein